MVEGFVGSRIVSDYWQEQLYSPIVPKSGPMRKIITLLDAAQALRHDLPPDYLKRDYWLRAGQAVVKAAYSGDYADMLDAYALLVSALDREGWLTAPPKTGLAPNVIPLPTGIERVL